MTESPTQPPKTPNMWIEYGPIIVFVALYNILRMRGVEGAIFIAAGVFAVAAIIALIYGRVKEGVIPKMLLLTTVIIVISVGLALFTGNPIFVYMKPTVVNIIFGLAVIGGAIANKNVLKMMMGSAYKMSDEAWNKFAIRWGLFFFAMAAVNEIVWRNFSEGFWANFKLFGFMPLTLIFLLTQMPFLLKHSDIKERMDEPQIKD